MSYVKQIIVRNLELFAHTVYWKILRHKFLKDGSLSQINS